MEKKRFRIHAKAVPESLSALSAAVCAALLLFFPADCAGDVRAGLSLCAKSVIPSLFPFMVLSPLLCDAAARLFRGQAQTASLLTAFLLGMTTGFPIGALTVIDAYENGILGREQAERTLAVCNGTGPAFLVGYAGVTLCGNAAVGWLYVLLQCSAALGTALLFCFVWKKKHNENPSAQAQMRQKNPAERKNLPETVRSACLQMLTVCGFVVFFSVLRGLVFRFCTAFGASKGFAVFLCGILEMTGGLADAAALYAGNSVLCFPLSAFFIGFGGVCVFLQTASFARRAGLSLRWYLPEKLVCGILCAAMAWIVK